MFELFYFVASGFHAFTSTDPIPWNGGGKPHFRRFTNTTPQPW